MRIQDYITKPFNFRYYRPLIENKTDCVIFCHGQGERGPADGSQITLVERNSGWPKFAKGKRPGGTVETGNIEYPFNIIAPQVVINYEEINRFVVPWVVSRFGYKNIILVGISMGNYAIYNMIRYEGDFLTKNVKGFVACCGAATPANAPKMSKLPGLAWHGTDDTIVKYADHKNFVDAYNAAGGKVEFMTLQGVKHDAWNYAFRANPTEDKSLEFVNGIFAANKVLPPVPVPTTPIYNPDVEFNRTLELVKATIETLKKPMI
jgi:predicted esterase